MDTKRLRDTAERLVWTAISAALGVLPTVLGDVPAEWAPVIIAAINAVTIWVRNHLNALPSAGEGLPGLPVPEGGTS